MKRTVVGLTATLLCGVICAPAWAQAARVTLCEALAEIKAGEQRSIEVVGLYTFGFEHQILYDPEEPRCRWNVQPATWVEFSAETDVGGLSRAIGKSDRALVTMRGVLYGPQLPQPDSPKLPGEIASGIRVSNRGYGHLNVFRTKLVVDAVVDARAVPASVPRMVEWNSFPLESIPRILSALMPTYPHFARFGGIEGAVEIRVTIRDGVVTETQVLSGERILADDTLKNIRSWRFAEKANSSFVTRFVYELERREAGANTNARVDAQLPTFVRVIGASNDW